MCGPKLYEYTCGATEKGDQSSFTTCNLAPPICARHTFQHWPMAGRCGDCATCRIVENGGGIGNSRGSGGYDRPSGRKYKPKSGHQYNTNLSDERIEAAESIEKRRDEAGLLSKYKPTSRDRVIVVNDRGEHENCACSDCEGSCMLLLYIRCKNDDGNKVHDHHVHDDFQSTDDTNEDENDISFGEDSFEFAEENTHTGFLKVENDSLSEEQEEKDESSDGSDDNLSRDTNESSDSDNDDDDESDDDDQDCEKSEQSKPLKCKGRHTGRHYELLSSALLQRDPEDIQKDAILSIDDLFDEENYCDWVGEMNEVFRDNGINTKLQLDYLQAFANLLQSQNCKAHEFTGGVDTDESEKRQAWINRLYQTLGTENKERLKNEKKEKKLKKRI